MYMYIYCIYVCMYYANFSMHAIIRLCYTRSKDSQGQERFTAPCADKQTCPATVTQSA